MSETLRKQLNPEKAKIRLEEICARAEHSEGELREKLYKWGIRSKDADGIIASLRSEKFVDDLRFARAYVRDKYRFNHWGRRKIAQGLYSKRVDKDVAADALAEIDVDEYAEILENLLISKVKAKPELMSSFEGRQKIYRFALSRGFESSLIVDTLKKIVKKRNFK